MLVIRKAERKDVPVIFALIKGLAEYENAPQEVTNTVAALSNDLFENKFCEAIVAEEAEQVIGFALWYTSYSTWKGPCIYLEDFYVLPEKRRSGAGSMLFDAVVDVARERKAPRLEWQVLNWNQLAIDFYEKRGATIDKEWFNGRMFFPENETK